MSFLRFWYFPFIFTLTLVYVARIIKNTLNLCQIKRSQKRVLAFITVHKNSGVTIKEMKSILRYQHVIRRYVPHVKLSNGTPVYEFYRVCSNLYILLLDKEDLARAKLYASFNPFDTLKTIIMFPVSTLSKQSHTFTGLKAFLAYIPGAVIEALISFVIANLWEWLKSLLF